jgi:hypothetical protein
VPREYEPSTLTPDELAALNARQARKYGRAWTDPDVDESQRVGDVLAEAVDVEQQRRRRAGKPKRRRAA